MFLRLTAQCSNSLHPDGHAVVINSHRIHTCQPWMDNETYSWFFLDDAAFVIMQEFSSFRDILRPPGFIELSLERNSDLNPMPTLVRRDSIMSLERSHDKDKTNVHLVNGFTGRTKLPFEELIHLLTMNGIQ